MDNSKNKKVSQPCFCHKKYGKKCSYHNYISEHGYRWVCAFCWKRMAYSFKQQSPCNKCLHGAALKKHRNNKAKTVEIFESKIAEYNQYFNRTVDIGQVEQDEDGAVITTSNNKLAQHMVSVHLYDLLYNMMQNASFKGSNYEEEEIPQDQLKPHRNCDTCVDLVIDSIIGESSAALLQPYLASLEKDEDTEIQQLITNYENCIRVHLCNKVSNKLFSKYLHKKFYTLKREGGFCISIEGSKPIFDRFDFHQQDEYQLDKQKNLLAWKLSELSVSNSQFTFLPIEDAKEIKNECDQESLFKGHEGTDEDKMLHFEVDATNLNKQEEVEIQLETTSQLEQFTNVVSQKVDSTLQYNSEVVESEHEYQMTEEEKKQLDENMKFVEQFNKELKQNEEKIDEEISVKDSISFSSNLTPVDIFARNQPELYKEYNKLAPLLEKLQVLQMHYKEVDDVKYRKSLELLKVVADLQEKMMFNIVKFNSGVIDLDAFSNLRKEFKKLEKKYLNLKKN